MCDYDSKMKLPVGQKTSFWVSRNSHFFVKSSTTKVLFCLTFWQFLNLTQIQKNSNNLKSSLIKSKMLSNTSYANQNLIFLRVILLILHNLYEHKFGYLAFWRLTIFKSSTTAPVQNKNIWQKYCEIIKKILDFPKKWRRFKKFLQTLKEWKWGQ